MSKRGRLVLILAVLAVCFLFLWPTLQWYANTPKDQQALALSSLENIKDYSSHKASSDVKAMKAAVKEDKSTPLAENQKWLEKAAKKNYKDMEQAAPSPMTLYDALASFSSQEELVELIEKRYRDEILKNKKYYQNSVKLGLDLSGGMNVIVKADLDSVVKAQKDNIVVADE